MSERIKVIDSYCGSGKTTYAIRRINEEKDGRKFLFITPFLSECQRVIDECPRADFVQPNVRNGRGRKMNHFLQLIQEEKNIVSTHSLFANISDDIVEALRVSNYILILDEAFSVLDNFDLWKRDFTYASSEYKENLTRKNLKTLEAKGFIEVADDYQITWIEEENDLDKYDVLKRLADRGLLFAVRGSLLLWSFPVEVFNRDFFSEIYILTYQFSAQMQKYYYTYFGVEYDLYHVEKNPETGEYEIIPTVDGEEHDLAWRKEIKSKIHIVENEKMNKIGNSYIDGKGREQYTSLSKNWYKRFSESMMPIIQNRLSNFFGNMSDAPASDRMWTSFAVDKENFRTRNVNPRQWVALNARATNSFRNRIAVAYMVNRFLSPMYQAFFDVRGVRIDEDKYALSELVQFLWRSAIRDGNDIELYIPSFRMRSLLKLWLDGKPLHLYKEGVPQ